MKRLLVAALIRLYPARWRSEYGAEFTEVLLRRPIGVRELVNVVGSAIWQQCRGGEPWMLIGIPFLALETFVVVSAMRGEPFADLSRRGGWPAQFIQFALFFAVGFWTIMRRGRAAGRAGMKFNMIATCPFIAAGLLALSGALHITIVNAKAQPEYWTAFLVLAPFAQLPYAGAVAWLGGRAARVARRLHDDVTA